MNQLNAAVAMIVFNRPEPTRQVFAAISKARPSRLLLIADGPRPGRAGEQERCDEVRKIVSHVDWPCQVDTNFSSENLGCRQRVVSGLNWVFSLVEEAIIMEDDCLPHPSFFPYCEEMLRRYRDVQNIAMVSGFFPVEDIFSFPFSYYFSVVPWIWGWATWRRAWQQYDAGIKSWPEVKAAGLLRHILQDRRMTTFWTGVFDRQYQGIGPDAWSYDWVYTCWSRGWLNIVPGKNLIHNIGYGPDAAHTKVHDARAVLEAKEMAFPLKHPPIVAPWPDHVRAMYKRIYALPPIATRIQRKLARLRGNPS